MVITANYKLQPLTACFNSIKLGGLLERALREDCLRNNLIAINFGMTEARHQKLMELVSDEIAFREFLKGEAARKTAYWENQHHFFYRPDSTAVWLTVDRGFLYFAEDIETLEKDAFTPVASDGWIKRKVKPWQKVAIPVSKLPGVVRNLSVQRQTIVEIANDKKHDLFELIKNVINQEKPLVNAYQNAYKYEPPIKAGNKQGDN